METVVPYLRYGEDLRPVEIPPETPDDFLAQYAASYMGQPRQIAVLHRPIRTGDEIQMVTASDAQIRQEIQLQAVREDDKMLPPPPTSKAPQTMRQGLSQVPPRAHFQEIQLLWEIAKPALAAQERLLVTLYLQETIQDPAQRKAFFARVRDESWEATAERAYRFPIKIDTEVRRIEEGAVIPCFADF
jgi:hypothetical protein